MSEADIKKYMQTPIFAQRCEQLSALIDGGLVPSDQDIADVLLLPVDFVGQAMAAQSLKLHFHAQGGVN